MRKYQRFVGVVIMEYNQVMSAYCLYWYCMSRWVVFESKLSKWIYSIVELCNYWLRWCWFIINWTINNKFQWHLNEIMKRFFQGNNLKMPSEKCRSLVHTSKYSCPNSFGHHDMKALSARPFLRRGWCFSLLLTEQAGEQPIELMVISNLRRHVAYVTSL